MKPPSKFQFRFFPIVVICLTACQSTHHIAGIDRALRHDTDDGVSTAQVGPWNDDRTVVATAQVIAPEGRQVLFPGRPVDMALSPDETLLAVKNDKDLLFIDVATGQVRQTLPTAQGGNSFHGVVWSPDGTHVWCTSATRFVYHAQRGADGLFKWQAEIKLPNSSTSRNVSPGGLALDVAGNLLYVALSRKNTVGIVDLNSGKVTGEIAVGIAPYGILLRGDKAYVSNWGGRQPGPADLTGPTAGSEAVINPAGIASTGSVSVIDLTSRQVRAEVETGLHPSGMALSPDGARLYVANANSDSITVIDTATYSVAATWEAKPAQALPFGSGPNALAASPDGTSLYVALGTNNCLAVMDTNNGVVRGLISTGWYPGAVCISRDGRQLAVANTKGLGSRFQADEAKPNSGLKAKDYQGSVSLIATPASEALPDYTYRAAVNMRLPHIWEGIAQAGPKGRREVPVPSRPGDVSVFKHVLYIIKENRTYDQVFGDMPEGNGDASLCQYGEEVTPNHHALAREFVLLDNFYCNGVCSADGHQWTDEGYVTDYIEKSFGGFTRSYPFDGGDALAYASSGFIWDHVLKAGLTFRNYGEMVRADIQPATATWSDVYRDYTTGSNSVQIRAVSQVRGLDPHTAPTFTGFPLNVPDVYRAREFLKEFRACEARGEWHNLVMMLLPNDHTAGTSPGSPTPRAAVADNDLALGTIVDAVSRSRFWPETLILVVEDDPQAGLDHVDGHRTVALCISPYTKRHSVNSTLYNQSSFLRTIELVFGLPPMNQLNLTAQALDACFTDTPDVTPYTVRPNQIPLDELNPPVATLHGLQRKLALESQALPLDDVDAADEDTFNRILWHASKGYDVAYPKRYTAEDQ